MRRTLIVLASVAALAAGCGGSSSSVGSGSSAASIVPADAAVFVSVDTDLSSGQLKQADELLQKFPGRQKLLDSLQSAFTDQGVDFAKLKDSIGPELDLAVLHLGDQPAVVALTQPKDEAEFDRLLESGSSPPKHERIGDWTVFSDEQASIDELKAAQSGDKLADKSSFSDAMGKLPEEALATAYADGPSVTGKLGASLPGQAGTLGLDGVRWAAGALEAKGEGASLQLVADGLDVGSGDYASQFLDRAPAGAVLFATFKGVGGAIGKAGSGAAAAAVEQALGMKLSDFAALFDGETAVWATPGTPLPEVTVALSGDPKRSLATLDTLAGRVALFAGGGSAKETTVDGVAMKEISLGPVSVLYGEVDGKVLVTDSRTAVRDFRSGSGGLAADTAFKAARDAAGMPDESGGFVYVNVPDAYAMVTGLAGVSGTTVPAGLDENLRPLRSFLAWGSRDGDLSTFRAFLEIR